MWHRADDSRVRAAATRWPSRGCGRRTSAARCSRFEQRHTSVETDFGHGLGEIITVAAARAAGRRQPRLRRRRSSTLTQEVPLQLRGHRPAAQRGRRPASTPAACATSTPPTCARPRADDRPAREGDAAWTRCRSAVKFAQGRPGPRGARQGRRGGQLGPRHAGRHRPGHRHPQGVQGRRPPRSWRSTAGPRPSAATSARP